MQIKQYKCIGTSVDISDVDALDDMTKQAQETTYRTMLKHCDLKSFDKFSVKLKDDWHVTFHKSKFQGIPCYFFQHSMIEYIFIKER